MSEKFAMKPRGGDSPSTIIRKGNGRCVAIVAGVIVILMLCTIVGLVLHFALDKSYQGPVKSSQQSGSESTTQMATGSESTTQMATGSESTTETTTASSTTPVVTSGQGNTTRSESTTQTILITTTTDRTKTTAPFDPCTDDDVITTEAGACFLAGIGPVLRASNETEICSALLDIATCAVNRINQKYNDTCTVQEKHAAVLHFQTEIVSLLSGFNKSVDIQACLDTDPELQTN